VIKASGGATIVQDPNEAMYAGMPASAIARVAVDAIVPSELVASTIAAMVKGDEPPAGSASTIPTRSRPRESG
jgi:two-component system, chemotaxis family, protein-glutamate methylesterase/glutaminase